MKRSSLVLVVGVLIGPAVMRCGGDEKASAAQCEDWSRQASLGRRAAQDQADRNCSADVDCEIVDYGLRCFADCGYATAVASTGL
jgi:hypothetical protein